MRVHAGVGDLESGGGELVGPGEGTGVGVVVAVDVVLGQDCLSVRRRGVRHGRRRGGCWRRGCR
jgi:hypothetical protein